jgi:AraC-like DNA-binding protein
MRRSARGLHFTGPARAHVAERLPAMIKQRGIQRVLELIALLDRLARSRGAQPLASPAYGRESHPADPRIDRVCRFIHDHATEPITQARAAKLLHMSGPAFSRFFRRSVGMTYSRYVHELRVGHACRMLLETGRPVTDVCFAGGFNNLSNFNRVFRSIKGVSPREYRLKHVRSSR